jgi:predicted transcriptional regulator
MDAKLGIRIDQSTKDALQEMADAEDRTLSQLIKLHLEKLVLSNNDEFAKKQAKAKIISQKINQR